MKLFLYPPTPISITVPPIAFSIDGTPTDVNISTTLPATSRPLPIIQYDSAGAVATPLTNTQLRASPVPVTDAANGALLGPVNETAPTTDIASSGLNGRLQRIAQNITTLLARLPATLGQKLMATSLPVTIASDQSALAVTGPATDAQLRASALPVTDTANGALLGPVTETAPASDTASSGLNGRLQRIAQRLTSILGILPAARGVNTSANSLGVVLASDQAQIPTDANAYLDISGSAALLNAFAIAATDVSKYKEIILAISGTYTGILTFQGSNDNTNWFSVNGSLINTGTNVPTQFISGAAGMFKIPAVFKYFRVQMTSYTSGTAVATAIATSGASTDLAMKTVSAAQSGTWNIGTVASITAAVTTASQSTAGAITSAQITVGTTAVRATVAGTAPNAARKLLLIKPLQGQSGRIWIGPSTVTIANGMEIIGPDRVEFDFDAGDYYMVSDTAGMTVEILEKV